jgi:hypothetical protein
VSVERYGVHPQVAKPTARGDASFGSTFETITRILSSSASIRWRASVDPMVRGPLALASARNGVVRRLSFVDRMTIPPPPIQAANQLLHAKS